MVLDVDVLPDLVNVSAAVVEEVDVFLTDVASDSVVGLSSCVLVFLGLLLVCVPPSEVR